jgi:peptidoglycan/xylan/chitin deacetylase (PgdA/CDA1 family)
VRQPGAFAKTTIKSLTATDLGWKAAGLLRGPGVLILLYHRIAAPDDRFPGLDVTVFKAQMQWLVAHCTLISPDQLHEFTRSPRSSRPPVLVTFDDGYLSYRERAYPVLKDLEIPALLFITTAYIDEPRRLFWWDALRAAVEQTNRRRVELPWNPRCPVTIDRPESRQLLLRAVKEHLKGVADKRRGIEVTELLDRLGVATACFDGVRQMLDWDDVRAISDVTHIGAHSDTHPILSMLTDAELEREVATCREKIRSAIGRTPRWFAYPNGRACDFDDRSRAALLRHGFDAAFTTVSGIAGVGVDWMALPRLAGDGTVGELAWRLSVRARYFRDDLGGDRQA